MEVVACIAFIIIIVLMGIAIGYCVGESETKADLAKKIVKDGKLYLKFKKGYETYNIKLEKKSHLSVHTTEDEIVDWKEI